MATRVRRKPGASERNREKSGGHTVTEQPKRRTTEKKKGIRITRHLTKPMANPFDEIEWEKRHAIISGENGEVVFFDLFVIPWPPTRVEGELKQMAHSLLSRQDIIDFRNTIRSGHYFNNRTQARAYSAENRR